MHEEQAAPSNKPPSLDYRSAVGHLIPPPRRT